MSGLFEGKDFLREDFDVSSGVLQLDLNAIYRSKFNNFQGYTFTVAGLNYPPFLMKKRDGTFSGYEIFQLETLAEYLNFKINIIEPPDGQWGMEMPNGEWTGLVGHALYGYSNWSMGSISLTEERERVIDFSFPFYFDVLGFVAPLPKELPKWQALYRPFLGEVWVGVITLIMIWGPIYWLVQRKGRAYSIQEKKPKLSSTSLYFIAIILRNNTASSFRTPTKLSSQTLLICWLLTSLIISAAYTGNLISFMAYPGIEDPINTVDDIIATGIDVEMHNYGGFETASFQATQNPSYKQIWNSKISVKTAGPSMQRVLQGKSVFVDYFSWLLPNVQTSYSSKLGKEMVHIGKTPFFSFSNGWAYQPDGIFKEAMDESLLLIMAYGFPHRWLDQATLELKANSPTSFMEDKVDSKFEPLTLENIQV